MKRIRSAATPFLPDVDVSNVTKLTGQMNCLHINSDLRFVSNVFCSAKNCCGGDITLQKRQWLVFIAAKNLMNKR